MNNANNQAKAKPIPKRSASARIASALTEKAKNLDTVVPILNASIRLNMIQGLIVAILTLSNIAALYAYASKPTEREYIIQDENGRIISGLLTLDKPLAQKNTVKARVDSCLRDTFNLDFLNYRTQLSSAEPCYTKKGFDELIANIDNQGLIRDLTTSYAVANLSPINPVRVTGSNVDFLDREVVQVKGSYAYKLSNGQQGKGIRKLNYELNIEAIVVEVPLTENSYGFAINRLTVRLSSA